MEEKKSESNTGPTHITRGNVFDDLGFSPEEAAAIKLKADLHAEILKIVRARKLSPKKLEKILDQPQPRISELLCGKISKMSAEKLVGYLSLLQVSVNIHAQEYFQDQVGP
ncbi:MAG: XRE family transcriptional regulator [Deltaproteobacteria bacterium]|nr:XRE family transcriptional regulator [Deltaproteobacteria bacterium]